MVEKQKTVLDKILSKGFKDAEPEQKQAKMSIFEKLDRVFTKEHLTKEEIGTDGFLILRFLAMQPEYTVSVNNIQKYLGVLGHRIFILLQYSFGHGNKTPWLDMVKREEVNYKRFSDNSIEILKKLFLVSRDRLEEYMPNLWVTEEEINEVWAVDKKAVKK